MTDSTKEIIDKMSYYEMLKLYRFAKISYPYFQGEIGEYFAEMMNKKEEELLPGEKVAISKQMGW